MLVFLMKFSYLVETFLCWSCRAVDSCDELSLTSHPIETLHSLANAQLLSCIARHLNIVTKLFCQTNQP